MIDCNEKKNNIYLFNQPQPPKVQTQYSLALSVGVGYVRIKPRGNTNKIITGVDVMDSHMSCEQK
jgi:hypothetical protein